VFGHHGSAFELGMVINEVAARPGRGQSRCDLGIE
jgi:hypothetical protein